MLVEAPQLVLFPNRLPQEGGIPGREAREKKFEPKSHEIALIGVGAGNLGLITNLDARGQLHTALQRGIGFYDAQPFGAGTLNILCSSNSNGEDFPAGLSQEGMFAQVRARSPLDGLTEFIDLREANSFYRAVGSQLENIVDSAEYPHSHVIQRRVSHVTFNPDHTEDNKRFTLHSYNAQTEESDVVGYANKVVFGTGAIQELSPLHAAREDLENKTLFTAEEVLSGDEINIKKVFTQLESLPPEQRKLAILGISHGALATAAEILLWDDKRVATGKERLLGEGAITMLARTEPRIFAANHEEAEALYGEKLDETLFAPNDTYNRFGGVRANAKDLLLRIKSKGDDQEKRVEIVMKPESKNIWTEPELDEKPIIIQAFGPSLNLVSVYDTNGKVINLFDEYGSLSIGEKGNLETTYGEDIGMFGIGIGYPRKKLSERMLKFAAPGENPRVVTAANAYATVIGEDVAEGLQLPIAA